MTLDSLFAALHRDGHVVTSEVPQIVFTDSSSPWYTRVLMGFMGWLGGVFVLGFLGALIAAFFTNSVLMMIVAIGLFAGSFAMYRAMPTNDFATQFALAASICAQIVATRAFSTALDRSVDTYNVAWFVALMQIALVMLMPNVLHRLLSTMIAVVALFVAAQKGLIVPALDAVLAVALVLLVRAESTLVAMGRRQLVEPVISGLAIALLVRGAAHVTIFGEAPWFPFALQTALVFSVALVAWVVLHTSRVATVPRIAAVLAAVVYVAATWRAPGLIASVLVVLVAFGSGRRALTAFALVALLAYLSTFYYQMHMTLMAKSMVLALSGASLLVMWWLHRIYFAGEVA